VDGTPLIFSVLAGIPTPITLVISLLRCLRLRSGCTVWSAALNYPSNLVTVMTVKELFMLVEVLDGRLTMTLSIEIGQMPVGDVC
jgi:hypothetical protein